MAKVYANGREILSEGDHGKIPAAFPDVCNSPPSPPAGPIPVPYADSSRAGQLKAGTKRVKIEGKPVGVRDQSYLKTSPLGNEAATKSLGANVVTHQVTGKTYFSSWSIDVEAEGKGVLRHLDLTTSNHGSYPGGTPPFPNLSDMQQLALDRISEGQCPCCGESSCAAAFKPGEEPLSMKEALNIDPRRPNFNAGRLEEYKLLKSMKKTECTCSGEVFPRPPCDVFREPSKDRHDAIVGQWKPPAYKKWYQKTHGVELKNSTHFLDVMVKSQPAATQRAMAAAAKLGKTARRADPNGRLFDDLSAEAKKLERINHLTPKESGGCPTNPGNLQPQQTLCLTCQSIDQFITDNWQG